MAEGMEYINGEVKVRYDKMLCDMLGKMHERVDETGLVGSDVTQKAVIHTRVTGHAHFIRANALYVQLVYMTGAEEKYKDCEAVIKKIIDAQDKDPKSRTYGLWGYYFEEAIKDMSDPDYNMAEFVSAPLIYLMEEKKELLSDELQSEISGALKRAAHCCIGRNVGLDYTNVIFMSSFTVIAIGEITGDKELTEKGKEELKKFVGYTRFNGGFSEYNSPCYFKIAGNSAARMIKYFKDEECVAIAHELNAYLWSMVSEHYSNAFMEMAPPYVRAYTDLDNGAENCDYIYYATNGAAGKYCGSSSEWMTDIPKCPDEFIENFNRDLYLRDVYYKKNNIRERDTDVTIVRDFESPDLVAVTNKNKQFMMGALQKTELWVQRRTSMIIWDKESPKCIKLRCIKDDFDFASGMAYTSADAATMVMLVGLCTDHGDKHYILDLFPDGKIKAKTLKFTYEFGQNSGNCRFERCGNVYRYKDDEISISVRADKWIYDGKPGEIRLTDKGIELICFEDSEQIVDLNALGAVYGVISVSVNGEAPETDITEKDGKVTVSACGGRYRICGYARPAEYNECMRNTVVK